MGEVTAMLQIQYLSGPLGADDPTAYVQDKDFQVQSGSGCPKKECPVYTPLKADVATTYAQLQEQINAAVSEWGLGGAPLELRGWLSYADIAQMQKVVQAAIKLLQRYSVTERRPLMLITTDDFPMSLNRVARFAADYAEGIRLARKDMPAQKKADAKATSPARKALAVVSPAAYLALKVWG
jgi:hypothetical protein